MHPPTRPTEAVAERAADALPSSLRDEALAARFGDGAIRGPALDRWLAAEGWTVEELMRALLPLAASMSYAPISGFHVGAVVATGGEERALYLGANFEFNGAPLTASVHAEQSAVNRAWLDGAASLAAIATSAAPCGHCRQFLSEILSESSDVEVITPDGNEALSALLPHAFLPEALGVRARLFEPVRVGLELQADGRDDELATRACAAASGSYVPYSNCAAGTALRMAEGPMVVGRCCENAAFNPSLSPLQSALAILGARTPGAPAIVEVVLAEEVGPVSHRLRDRELLERVAPDANFRAVTVVRDALWGLGVGRGASKPSTQD